MWFDVQAALAEIEGAPHVTPAADPPRHVAHVAHVARPPAPKSERDMSSKRIPRLHCESRTSSTVSGRRRSV